MVFPDGFLWGGKITHGEAGLNVLVGAPHGLQHSVALTTGTDNIVLDAVNLSLDNLMRHWFITLNFETVGSKSFYHVIFDNQEGAKGTVITQRSTDTINKILCMLLLGLCHPMTLGPVEPQNMLNMNGVTLTQ